HWPIVSYSIIRSVHAKMDDVVWALRSAKFQPDFLSRLCATHGRLHTPEKQDYERPNSSDYQVPIFLAFQFFARIDLNCQLNFLHQHSYLVRCNGPDV